MSSSYSNEAQKMESLCVRSSWKTHFSMTVSIILISKLPSKRVTGECNVVYATFMWTFGVPWYGKSGGILPIFSSF